MKVVGIVGSPRKKGNTDLLLSKVLEQVGSYGIDSEKIYISDYKFSACIGCEQCASTYKCPIQDDMQILYKKIEEADALVIGSPTYFYNVSGILKCFIDRLYCYDIFDESDRSVWISKNEVFGTKYAVTVAVCEQKIESDMGCTSSVMDMTLKAIGYRVVENVKVLHAFAKGDVLTDEATLLLAKNAGIKLAKTLKLAERVKHTLQSS